MAGPELTAWRVGSEYIGYGYHGQQMLEALEAIGVRVNPNHATKTIFSVCTPLHLLPWYEGQIMAILTMWETSFLPEGFYQPLISPGIRCFVPNHHNVKVFAERGLRAEFVPEGINPKHYFYTGGRKKDPTPFRWLNIGFPRARKGTDLVVKAFREHFSHLGHELWLKNESPTYGPGIVNVPRRLSLAEMRSLYAKANCFVGPSRGEGWYLPPFEALATGLPTIVANNTGMAEYAHLCQGAISGREELADYNVYGYSGYWIEPDYDELVGAMQNVFYNYSEALERAKASAEEIAKNWTWKQAAEKFIELMGADMYEKPTLGRIITPNVPKLPIVLKEDTKCNIGPKAYDLRKDKLYWLHFDAVRVLDDAGFRDKSMKCPECNTQLEHEGDWLKHVQQYAEA